MGTAQTSTGARQAAGRSAQTRSKKNSGAQRASGVSAATVETDDTYGLVSVLYHALQGAETIEQYIEDAKDADNPRLVAFFEDCQAKQNEIALQGKRLLAEQLIDLAEDEEEAADDIEDE